MSSAAMDVHLASLSVWLQRTPADGNHASSGGADNDELCLVEINTEVLWSRRHELASLAHKASVTRRLLGLAAAALQAADAAWVTGAATLADKLVVLEKEVLREKYGRGSALSACPEAEFLDVLLHGAASPPLELWLSRYLPEAQLVREMKKADKACVS